MDREKLWGFVGDHWLSLATVGLGFVSTALYGVGFLTPNATIGTILFLVSLLATTEIIERNKRLARIEELLERATLVESIAIHRGREQFFDYITARVKRATKRIDIVSPSTYGMTLYRQGEVEIEYLAAIKEAAKKRRVRVRRIRGLHNVQVLNETLDEIRAHLPAEFYVAAYPLRNKIEVPLLSVMIVDNEVAIGGIHKTASEDVITVTSNHPLILEAISDYFDSLLTRSVQLNSRTEVNQDAVTRLTVDLQEELEYVDNAAENYVRSTSIVSSARRRVFITSTLTSGFGGQDSIEGKMAYDAAVAELVLHHPDVEFRRIYRATTVEKLDDLVESARSQLNVANYLLRFVLDQRPAIDFLIKDDDIICLGLQDRESSLSHDSVIVVQNKTFVQAVVRWFERDLWPYAIPIKDKNGIVESEVVRIRQAMQNRSQDDKKE